MAFFLIAFFILHPLLCVCPRQELAPIKAKGSLPFRLTLGTWSQREAQPLVSALGTCVQGRLGPDLDQALLECSWNPQAATWSLVGSGAGPDWRDEHPRLGFLSLSGLVWGRLVALRCFLSLACFKVGVFSAGC